MSNMSYRDKMILLVLSIIIIIVAGIFALIRPKYQELAEDKTTLEATQEEWDGIDLKLQQIPVLQNAITDSKNEAEEIGSIFVNEVFAGENDSFDNSKVTFEVDQHIQKAVDAGSLIVNDMAITPPASTPVSYYYYTPNVLTYSLLQAADINDTTPADGSTPAEGVEIKQGNYAAKLEELMKTQTVLNERPTAEVMTSSVTMNVTGKKEGIMTFLDEIEKDPNAILVDTVNISDYQFTANENGEQPAAPAPGEAAPAAPAAGEGYSTMEVTVTYYNAKGIDEPNLEAEEAAPAAEPTSEAAAE